MQTLRRDASLSAFVAGLILPLIGISSSAVLVFQAATSAGLGPEQAGSWLGSLCIAMGLVGTLLSLYYRTPILLAWSTAGSALLVTSLPGVPVSEAIGAFLFSGLLIFLLGITGLFERIMNRIPVSFAAALLAGVLLHFSLDAVSGLVVQPLLVGGMCLAYLLGRNFFPRSTMMGVLLAGSVLSYLLHLLRVDAVSLSWTQLTFTSPKFTVSSLLSIGIPLFVVTMASQNLTGITVMRVNGYRTRISPILAWSGLANLVVAPFGGFSINLAAITAAIAMGPECHPDPKRRYFAGIVSGVIYLATGAVAGTIISLFSAFPKEMISALVGLALLGTISSSLKTALDEERSREASFITFVIAASGVTFFGVGAAFWAIVAGMTVQALFHFRPRVRG